MPEFDETGNPLNIPLDILRRRKAGQMLDEDVATLQRWAMTELTHLNEDQRQRVWNALPQIMASDPNAHQLMLQISKHAGIDSDRLQGKNSSQTILPAAAQQRAILTQQQSRMPQIDPERVLTEKLLREQKTTIL